MGGWGEFGRDEVLGSTDWGLGVARLWVDCARETWPAGDRTAAGMASTLTSEEGFTAALVSGEGTGSEGRATGFAERLAQRMVTRLNAGADMAEAVADMLAALPAGEHVAVALLRIGRDGRAELAEIDAPPLFMARQGDCVLLPVVEEEIAGRLVRRCDFTVRAGDHLALVSESYIGAREDARSWSWRAIALAVRRLTATGCDAEQLAGALVRLAESWKPGAGKRQVANSGSASRQVVLTMFVRPMGTATVWSGPPADRRQDEEALAWLMAEEGTRIICGDSTAQIAARLLDAALILDPRPADGWRDVPPTSRLVTRDSVEPVALVTEGVVTLRAVADRLAATRRPAELAGRSDGASRLAKLLLAADKVTFVVGLAVNPAQTERDGTPLRKSAVARVAEALRARGKLVAMEFV